MLEEEVDDGCGVLERMRMMLNAGLQDHFDHPARCTIPFLEDLGVFLERNSFICITTDAEHRDPGLGYGGRDFSAILQMLRGKLDELPKG